MGDQEMQFADPAWRPSQQLDSNADTQQQNPYRAQPVNIDTFEQSEQSDQGEAYVNSAFYTEGYRAQSAGGMPSISGVPLRTRPRRYRGPWLWIVLALVIFSLMSGAFSMNASRESVFPGYGGFPGGDRFDHGHIQSFAQLYKVGPHPTVEITDPIGSITVHTTAGSDNEVVVQTDQHGQQLVNTSPSGGDSLNITVNNDPSAEVNLDVTVGSEADLVLKTGSGDINVSGVNGQVQLTSDSGNINVSQVSVARNSTLVTNSGNITFDGAIAANGSYQFQTQSGSVDVTFPSDASFHADVSTSSGSINSKFPEVSTQPSNPNAAHGNVGNPPYAIVTIITDSGSIDLRKVS